MLESSAWKKWRAVLNPGFSTAQLMHQVSAIVDIVEDFVRVLDHHADKNDVFRLEEESAKTTIDIIGKVVCDHNFKSLSTENELVDTMRSILSWMLDAQSLDPFHRMHPLRKLLWRYYKPRMDRYIGRVLDEGFQARDASLPKNARKKTSIDIALEEYFKESGQDIDSSVATMNPDFRKKAIDHLLILLFAGRDTTASSVCYCYHELNKHPRKLARIRQELDDVFRKGVNAARPLRRDPYLTNKCEYTLAVIREALRLWSPVSTIRAGRKDSFLKDPVTGNMLPTDGMLVWLVPISTHRDPRFWPEDVGEFKPERFLSDAPQPVNPAAHDPLERGPRDCIGQELALIEMKVILALTIREFDIRAAYDETNSLNHDGSLWAAEKGSKYGLQEAFGDPAYQVLLASAKPSEGTPARVKRVVETK